MNASDELDGLAWAVLETVNEAQAKGSTVRLVVPRDVEVARELSTEPDDLRLLSAVEFLEDRGYLEPADIVLTRGAYTITLAGFAWLEDGPPIFSERPETPADSPAMAELHPPKRGARKGAGRVSWWRRVFGG
jgi:hypothetical protein